MNASKKLLAWIRDCAARILQQIESRDVTVADLTDARRTIAHMRADLIEIDQRLRAEIHAMIARPNPLVPPLVSDAEVDAYKQRLQAGLGGTSLADESLAGLDQVESPPRPQPAFRPPPLMPKFTPTHVFNPQLRRLLPLSGVVSSPGRRTA